MSLSFACIAAHTPLLIPTIGREGLERIAKTKEAMTALEQEFYLAQPDTAVVITPHAHGLPDSMTMNCSPSYSANFEEFGDLATKGKWRSDTLMIDRIREDFKAKHLPLTLDSVENLDYGSAVPLWYLTQHLPKVRIVSIQVSGLDAKSHYEFGRQLKDEIMISTKRVAVIASADLSHRAGENSPRGFSPRGVAYDEKVSAAVRDGRLAEMVDIDDEWSAEAEACGAKVLAMLAGVMDGVQHESSVLSYEKPFGVGYLVASLKVA